MNNIERMEHLAKDNRIAITARINPNFLYMGLQGLIGLGENKPRSKSDLVNALIRVIAEIMERDGYTSIPSSLEKSLVGLENHGFGLRTNERAKGEVRKKLGRLSQREIVNEQELKAMAEKINRDLKGGGEEKKKEDQSIAKKALGGSGKSDSSGIAPANPF